MEPLEVPTTPPPRVPRRTPRACKQCRAAKIKCSGSRPCTRCTRRRDECVFPSDEPHVSVPERYLRDLQRRVADMQVAAASQCETAMRRGDEAQVSASATAAPVSNTAASVSDTDIAAALSPLASLPNDPPADPPPDPPAPPDPLAPPVPPLINPLVSRNLTYIQESSGRPRYLGPTSTWSFCRRALLVLERNTPSSDGSSSSLNTDGTAFRLRWEPSANVCPEHLGDIPPRDYALHLFSTAKFHLGDFFGAVDEANFYSNLDQFYQNPLVTAQRERLWFITYLLFLSFGKAFLASGRSSSGIPGSHYAARAMSLLPDAAHMHDVPIPSIEVLTLVALYFQSIDMRSSAYQYIGQALRLCFIEGIHRHVPDDVINPHFAKRCHNLWWVVYVLDQEITANMGCPSAVPDGMVTVSFPSETSADCAAKALTLRIRLSRLTASMCSTVYSITKGLGNSFVRSTTSFLQQLATLSRELDATTSGSSFPLNSEVPPIFRQLTLSYHHCIILATRPLVMWLLILSVEQSPSRPQQLAGPVSTLLKTSAESAMAIVTMLHTLVEQDMLECFLPFQLDYIFAAALLLSIMEAILPSYVPSGDWSRSVSTVFEEMISKKNVVAALKKSEIEHLHTLLLSVHGTEHGILSHWQLTHDGKIDTVVGISEDRVPSLSPKGDVSVSGLDLPWNDLLSISNATFNNPDHILELAEQFQVSELDSSWLFEP